MTDRPEPAPRKRRPRPAGDEESADVASVVNKVSTEPARPAPPTSEPFVQVNVRLPQSLHQLMVDQKFERRTSIREVVEHALHSTYGSPKEPS